MSTTAERRRRAQPADAPPWAGGYRPYDLVKEFVAALVAMVLLTVLLAAVLGSPDRPAISLKEWATAAPGDFASTAATELAGTSASATYGAPYTRDPGAGQKLGPIPLQRWGGVREPVDTAQDFVIGPLSTVPGDLGLRLALRRYEAAPRVQQQAWSTRYADALAKAGGDPARVAAGDYGPVPTLVARLLGLARAGGLDGLLVTATGPFQTDYAKQLLFLSDGTYLENQARAQHLGGDQWGMMNETGSYPGQAWLWLYTFWYQIQPFSTSDNADAWVWALMMVLSLGLVLVPFIPGVRSIPRLTRVYRVIWRDHYRRLD